MSQMLKSSQAAVTKERIIRNNVGQAVLYATYGILAIQDRRQSKEELAQYEKTLKADFPKAYRLSGQRKFLHIARGLRYQPFFLMRRYAAKKYV